jgi:hypothetical protein
LSGLAPIAVYLSVSLIVGLGLLWVVAKALKWGATYVIGLALASVSTICIGYLAIEKFVGVHYTSGFYMAVALMLVVGVGAGLALRRNR